LFVYAFFPFLSQSGISGTQRKFLGFIHRLSSRAALAVPGQWYPDSRLHGLGSKFCVAREFLCQEVLSWGGELWRRKILLRSARTPIR
jgi:hypothetical protein